MQSLEQLQKEFQLALFNKSKRFLDAIASQESEERFAVNRGTVYDALCHALEVIFPGVWKLLGKQCADTAALLFCQKEDNLPQTACLDRWGKNFPMFLNIVPEFNSLPYLKDYARYEYMRHQVYCGFGRSAYFFESKYPINEIQTLLDNPNSEAIDLKLKQSYAIITRPKDIVLTYWVTEQQWNSVQGQVKEGSYV